MLEGTFPPSGSDATTLQLDGYLFDQDLESFDEKPLHFIINEWQKGEVVGFDPQFCYPFSLLSKGMVDE